MNKITYAGEKNKEIQYMINNFVFQLCRDNFIVYQVLRWAIIGVECTTSCLLDRHSTV
jgi:hypothetical protein